MEDSPTLFLLHSSQNEPKSGLVSLPDVKLQLERRTENQMFDIMWALKAFVGSSVSVSEQY